MVKLLGLLISFAYRWIGVNDILQIYYKPDILKDNIDAGMSWIRLASRAGVCLIGQRHNAYYSKLQLFTETIYAKVVSCKANNSVITVLSPTADTKTLYLMHLCFDIKRCVWLTGAVCYHVIKLVLASVQLSCKEHQLIEKS